MENSASKATVIEPLLKKVEFVEVLDVVPQHIQTVNDFHPLQKRSNLIFKRMVDLVVSTILIAGLLSWLFPIIAILVKLSSSGPVLFFQKRGKRNGGVFTCIKFRTMIVNKQADELPACNEDHRVTRIGYFLRRHHIDELPQLFNVWLGDMSLIGPRPHMISDNEKFGELLEFYHSRNRVKPGITGLAQVLGLVGVIHTPENMKARLEKDIYYINHWSPAMDARIIYRTVFKMIGI